MARGDGTGPAGMGPMTGRGAGYCAGYPIPGYMNPYGGRFMGLPYAAPPWGMQYGPYEVPYSKEQEKEVLQGQVKSMEDQIAVIQKRIEELETDASKASKSSK